MKLFMSSIDAVSEFTGKIAAWCLFFVGFFITYEVVMRHVFTAPTIWVDEVSRILQVWVVFLAASYALKHRDMVTIEIILSNPDTLRRRLAETFAIAMLVIFAGTAAYYGYGLWLKETMAGHTTETYLAPPRWLTDAPVWIGSVLLILQALVQLIRIWTEDIPHDDVLEGAH